MSTVTIVIPMLNEASALPALVTRIAQLDPAPDEVLCVDGGSTDQSARMAAEAGWRVISAKRGRGSQINAGVAAATSALVVVLHADTQPPVDMVTVIACHAG